MTYTLDTNTLIYFFRGEGQVAARLLEHPPSAIAVPSVVVYELETGLAKMSSPERRRTQLAALLSHVTVQPFGLAEARCAGGLRATLEAAGTPIGPMDLLIAATALTHKTTLVTRNTREFGRVPGLGLVDWFGA